MPAREYIKLTPVRQRGGLAVISAARSNLWLGRDHLLSVETEGYTESYKRFYFRDLQAITLRKTARMIVLAVGFGVLTAFFGFITLSVDAIEARWVFGVLTALCALPFLLNFVYGPTCACQFRTAVQVEEVPSLGRVRRARKVIARLRPLIAEAQGQLDAEAIPQLMQDLATEANAPAPGGFADDPNTPPVIARTASAPRPELIRPYRSRVHLILCCLLLADLPLTIPHFFVQSGWLDALATLLMVGTVAAAIVAVVKQQRTDLPANLKAVPWITIIASGVFFVVGIGYVFFLAVNNPGAVQQFSPMEDPMMLVMTLLSTALSVILGALGLLWLHKFRSASAAPPPPPAAGLSVN